MNPLAYFVERAQDWLRDTCTGDFSGFLLGKELGIESPDDRSQVLSDLMSMGLVEPVRGKHGVFSKVSNDCPRIDWQGAQEAWFPLRMPFGLDTMCGVRPKNIIVVAGETNAGKTLFALQIAHDNLAQNGGQHGQVSYFNSEMGPDELRARLMKLDPLSGAWNGLEAFERKREFHAVVRPDGVNILDYMEVSDRFYLVADWIEKIHAKLTTGICVICLQKPQGKDTGRGGDFTLEKARLALALSYAHGVNVAKIVKCKNPLRGDMNPQGQEIDYRIVQGSRCDMLTPWRWVNEKERKGLLQQYEREQIAMKCRSRWADDSAA
jgi:hypothetical protein